MIVRHLLSILLLPFTVAVIVPIVLLGARTPGSSPLGVVSGGVVMLLGLGLVGRTIAHFATRGQGTLAPWDPPRRLVVTGIYRYARNPMITGVLLVLVGESLLFASTRVATWAAVVFAVNAVYLPLVEEPDLVSRFGEDYEEYRRHVPRWVPRLTPWHPAVQNVAPPA
jgi:protein-S-isoprenylcysteine O-methyltransferase Ste14